MLSSCSTRASRSPSAHRRKSRLTLMSSRPTSAAAAQRRRRATRPSGPPFCRPARRACINQHKSKEGAFRMKKNVTALCLTTMLGGIALSPLPAFADDLVIGLATAQTGGLAPYDQPSLKGLEMAVEEIN